MTDTGNDCNAPLHPQAAEGIELFNAGRYFEAHEALEIAWRDETGPIRNLYRGILQIAVVYLHIKRGNYNGAVKVYARSQKWMMNWADICRGVDVERLQQDAEAVNLAVQRLGQERIGEFDLQLLKPVRWKQGWRKEAQVYACDRCGNRMYESTCKIVCPNCGNRFDCSDLNIYFD
jgi:predicted metal-dependent hydrolase/predicted RNA-binding Zn-ribbon protein involved in translation (DUF1610 family)